MVKKVLSYSLIAYGALLLLFPIMAAVNGRLDALKDPEFIKMQLIFLIGLAAVFFIGMFIGVVICAIVRKPSLEWRFYLAAQILLFLPLCIYIIYSVVPGYLLYAFLYLFIYGF